MGALLPHPETITTSLLIFQLCQENRRIPSRGKQPWNRFYLKLRLRLYLGDESSNLHLL